MARLLYVEDKDMNRDMFSRRLQAARRLKAAPETQGIVIIGVTAHAMASDRDGCLAAGATTPNTKPVELGRLAGKIKCLLGTGAA